MARADTYETQAEPQIRALARERDGFLLIVTQAVHLADLNAGTLTRARIPHDGHRLGATRTPSAHMTRPR